MDSQPLGLAAAHASGYGHSYFLTFEGFSNWAEAFHDHP